MTQNVPTQRSPTDGVPSALDRIEEISPPGRRLAVFLDYDGTLTPIVSQPRQAGISDSTRRVMRMLAARVPVAILSGRDLEDVRQRVQIDGIAYAGSHGFDIAGPRGLRKQVATEFLDVLDAAEKELGEKLAGIAGALLERKRYSVAAHYRNVAESDAIAVERQVIEVAARHRELRKIDNEKVYELQPNVEWDKGRALLWLLESLGEKQLEALPIYIGDDLTDEDAFRALRGRGVGVVVSEQPRQTAARYALKNPTEVERFLYELARRAE